VLSKIPDVEINIKPVDAMGSSDSPIQLIIIGNDYEKLTLLSREILEGLKNIKGTMDISSTLEPGKPEFKIIPKREKLSLYGLTEASLALTMRGFIEGTVSTVYREGDDEYDIKLKLDDDFRTDVTNLQNLELTNSFGGVVHLGEVADIIETQGPSRLERFSRTKSITLSSNVSGRSVGEVLNDIKAYLKTIEMPPGFDFIFSGEVERMENSFTSLFTSLILALIFTYMLLAGLLESFIHPFTILISFPLAFTGMFLGLFTTGMTWSIFSIMAVVMLVGIVVNNGILLIENIRLLRTDGMTCHDAIIEGCPPRLRPIIMTTASACGAMIPLAMGLGAGAEMRASMAVVEIGGMITSAVLSIIVIPVIYYIVETKFKTDPALKKASESS
jgi:HAE1 family hydrophobic/amphiphilic exporter-1